MNLLGILKEEFTSEILMGIVLLLPFMLAQGLLYFRSFCKCDGIGINSGAGPRDKKSNLAYLIVCILIDIFNLFVVMCGKSAWVSFITCDDVDIVMPIITTILISFFGLTAASYTFQVNDMHEQQRQFPNDSSFIDIYLERTRFKFSVALWSTVLICVLSVSIFMLGKLLEQGGIANYKLECGFILCVLSTELIMWMLYLNWVLFFHERYIDKYTKRILKYTVDLADEEVKLPQMLKRVNSLEMIFQRILQNSVHVQEVYPLANRDLLAMVGADALEADEESDKWENAENLVKFYDELIRWRNAVIHLQNSRNVKRKANLTPGLRQIEKLEKIEKYLKERRLVNERFTDMDLSSMEFFGESNLQNTDFSGCDLRNISLKGSNCNGANFSNALMSQIRLGGSLTEKGIWIDGETKLSCGNFYNCNLGNSTILYERLAEGSNEENDYFDMAEGNFNRVKFTNSEMQRVDFELSSFDKAQLYYNKWKSCCAKLVIFSDAMFSNSRLLNTDFSKADFSGAVLVNAVMKDCCFEEARLHKVDLSNSEIGGGNWNKIMATGASFKNVKVLPVVPEEELSGIDVPNPMFCRSVLRNVDFTECSLTHVDMSDSQVGECIFTGATGRKNRFCNADMTNCLFNRTKWERCFFDYVQFDRSVFKNAEFSKSRFVGTSFEQCLFLNTENGGQSKPEILKAWEEVIFKGNQETFNALADEPSNRSVFEKSYLEKISFKGTVGLTEQMFHGAVVVGIDFRGTGIKWRALHKQASKVIKCKF